MCYVRVSVQRLPIPPPFPDLASSPWKKGSAIASAVKRAPLKDPTAWKRITVGIEHIVEARENLHGKKKWWKPEYAVFTLDEHEHSMAYNKKRKRSRGAKAQEAVKEEEKEEEEEEEKEEEEGEEEGVGGTDEDD
jgi:hypothetical protein